MRATVTEKPYPPETPDSAPFGREAQAVQHPDTLALGMRLNAAARAVQSGQATAEQRALLSDVDAAMTRAAQSRPR